MWHYIKQAFIPFIYLLFLAVSAVGVLMISDQLIWLKVVLLILNLGLYVFVVGLISNKEGQIGYKALLANDMERMIIIKTGEDRPLKIHQEYAWWKGFLVGAVTCAPLVILLIVHLILFYTAGPQYNGAGTIGSFIYMVFAGFAKIDSRVPIAQWQYYFTLISIPIMMAITGIPYIIGAKKMEKQQEQIAERQRQIYGEDNKQ